MISNLVLRTVSHTNGNMSRLFQPVRVSVNVITPSMNGTNGNVIDREIAVCFFNMRIKIFFRVPVWSRRVFLLNFIPSWKDRRFIRLIFPRRSFLFQNRDVRNEAFMEFLWLRPHFPIRNTSKTRVTIYPFIRAFIAAVRFFLFFLLTAPYRWRAYSYGGGCFFRQFGIFS